MAQMNKECVVFDIDGTLADISHRLHFINNGGKKDWAGFNSMMSHDDPKPVVISLLQHMYGSGYWVYLVTGRQECYREETEAWLKKHNIEYDQMFMRPTDNYDPDYQVKEKILDLDLAGCKIFFVVDDRDQVVEMWRRRGITCLQCQKGDY